MTTNIEINYSRVSTRLGIISRMSEKGKETLLEKARKRLPDHIKKEIDNETKNLCIMNLSLRIEKPIGIPQQEILKLL